jgi:hypothetical protein
MFLLFSVWVNRINSLVPNIIVGIHDILARFVKRRLPAAEGDAINFHVWVG